MCLPLGPSRGYYQSDKPGYISKGEAHNMTLEDDCIIECRPKGKAGRGYKPFTGNTYFFIYDDCTRVRIALPNSKDYREGFESVIASAPWEDDVLVIRTPKSSPTK